MYDPAICVTQLEDAPWMQAHTRRLPGVQPMRFEDWLRVDAAYAGQMALREGLIAHHREAVYACPPMAQQAAQELLALVLQHLPGLGFQQIGDVVQCPDGRQVALDQPPLICLGLLLQCDFCLHLPDAQGDYGMVAAILCFPAGWTLSEKIGRSLVRIHRPIEPYTESIANSVQRMFSVIRPAQPLMRANAHYTSSPLFNPRLETAPRVLDVEPSDYIRSERQCFVRLPDSQAVVFSIHTRLIKAADLSQEQAAALRENPLHTAA